ncbi:MAG: hypothetical protein ACUVTB_06935, partial [Candidatus Bathycorpusculaceae bacterium]
IEKEEFCRRFSTLRGSNLAPVINEPYPRWHAIYFLKSHFDKFFCDALQVIVAENPMHRCMS